MKILIACHYFLPHHGGIENVVFNQAKELVSLGHDVTIVTSLLPIHPEDDVSGAKVIRVPAWNILENKLGLPYPLFSPRLARVLKFEIKQTDAVQVHSHVFMPSIIAAHYAKVFRKPLILTQHNTFVEYDSAILQVLQRVADLTLGRYTIQRAAQVLAVSGATKAYVTSIFRLARSMVHYNGIDPERFKPVQNQTKLRDRLNLPRNKTIFFTIRRITFKNGIDTLLETAKLMKDNPEVLFMIGGTGPDLAAAQAFVHLHHLMNVVFLGFVSDTDLPDYYAAADVFILPSKKGEGFPLVVLEALSSGIPVISTRSGGHVEILESSPCGYVVEPDQPDSIARVVMELSNDPQKLSSMKLSSRRHIESSLTWKKNVAHLVSCLDKGLAL